MIAKNYRSKLNLQKDKGGGKRKYELINNAFENNTFNILPVEYKDIDKSFTQWVENELSISFDGKLLPTMTLFSNQRFSEYGQSWEYTDDNKNLLMNFKTISRDNNPSMGKNQGGNWNIPGESFYTVMRKMVVNDGGFESFIDYKMRQPFAITLNYEVTIITNKYELLNEFNILVNSKFKSRQCYISPSNYYMPLYLEDIDDKSEYNIDDRQFFKQTFAISIDAYIIRAEDLKIEETPKRQLMCFESGNGRPSVDIEEIDEIKFNEDGRYYYKPTILTLNFSTKSNMVKFNIDIDFKVLNAVVENIQKYDIWVNDEPLNSNDIVFNLGDEIKIKIKRNYIEKSSQLTINGYDLNVIYDENKNIITNDYENNQVDGKIEINF